MRAVFAKAVLLPLLRFCEVKRPREEVGAVGSIELMVAMAVVAIATFNLKKVSLALRQGHKYLMTFFTSIVFCRIL